MTNVNVSVLGAGAFGTSLALYSHRLGHNRATEPHAGFPMLADWAVGKRHGAFVFTSNVDGQFQKAGFAPERVAECHGSIHHLQCSAVCSPSIIAAVACRAIHLPLSRTLMRVFRRSNSKGS